MNYTATAGVLILKRDDGKARASIFFVAYTLDNADTATRPLTFAFNGGPGSSSVWLHMGALGPRRVRTFPRMEPRRLRPTGLWITKTLLSNSGIWFSSTRSALALAAPRRVKIPRNSTATTAISKKSRISSGLPLTRFDRWLSPKFLAGESYGTTRAAGLSQFLIRQDGIYLNGISLISSVLNFETIRFSPGHDLPYLLYLPTYTAAAWYHKKLPADLQSISLEKAVEQARKFAAGDYTLALMKGDKLTAAERTDLANKLARWTVMYVCFRFVTSTAG